MVTTISSSSFPPWLLTKANDTHQRFEDLFRQDDATGGEVEVESRKI